MSILVGIGTLILLAGGAARHERPRVPLYTNDDLARVSPHRPDTGVASVPATPPSASPTRPEPPDETKTESYWRTRARRLQERLEPLRDQLADLRLRLAEKRRPSRRRPPARSQARSRPSDDAGDALLESQIARLEARIRDAESRLEDDARRAGALPGWLR